uniref:Uncharacterized protein n=1 Tax=Anopheles farauti TaxID=69004 RepID=A0A182QUQ0_9DIPT
MCTGTFFSTKYGFGIGTFTSYGTFFSTVYGKGLFINDERSKHIFGDVEVYFRHSLDLKRPRIDKIFRRNGKIDANVKCLQTMPGLQEGMFCPAFNGSVTKMALSPESMQQ